MGVANSNLITVFSAVPKFDVGTLLSLPLYGYRKVEACKCGESGS